MFAAAMLFMLQGASPVISPRSSDPDHELNLDFKLDAAFIAQADRNGDGALDLSEYQSEFDRRLDAAIAANPAAQRKFGSAERSRIRSGMLAPSFRSFDRNSDGLITDAEIRAAASNN